MTEEDIIRMAREAGFDTDLPVFQDGSAIALKLAALVAAAEREACAKVCDDKHDTWRWDDAADSASGPRDCAAAIRARGQDPMPLFDDWGGFK